MFLHRWMNGVGRPKITLVLLFVMLGASTLAHVPPAKAWLGFSLWYGNRTSNSVVIYWTARGQEDAPTTPADQVHLCWTADPSDYPCNSNSTYFGQYQSVGSTVTYQITGLACYRSYRVMVGQPYILATSGDWHEQTITIPAACSGWTDWYDRDDESGNGDWEHLMYFPDVCLSPSAVEAQTIYGVDWTLTGETLTVSPSQGLICQNNQQPDGWCQDYRVRFYC